MKASSTPTESVTKNKFTYIVAKFIPVTKSKAQEYKINLIFIGFYTNVNIWPYLTCQKSFPEKVLETRFCLQS